jgi:hypothetical protein
MPLNGSFKSQPKQTAPATTEVKPPKQRKKKAEYKAQQIAESQTHELQLELEGFPFWQERTSQSTYGLRKSVSMKIPYAQAEEMQKQPKKQKQKKSSTTPVDNSILQEQQQKAPESTPSTKPVQNKVPLEDISFEDAFMVDDVKFGFGDTTPAVVTTPNNVGNDIGIPEEGDKFLDDFAMSVRIFKFYSHSIARVVENLALIIRIFPLVLKFQRI